MLLNDEYFMSCLGSISNKGSQIINQTEKTAVCLMLAEQNVFLVQDGEIRMTNVCFIVIFLIQFEW